ncbi:hypothetical protein Kpol_1010p67 [Vanderwaltozyma polyspora DSM 70294]|uniref:3-oxo-5-alpha-steroid 4-dehydrogenase C-terminal domain-containing protein n=1 Tax=Vanderwaltozyma polyspora (strain ATCC 22028 / DSM 70294 / BCRC 21397 / CBS 2163 / NBRC 10782 / NRRL Y-8283 / UCD 57-17) TaxID=436907 RepID=A7TIL1_VANPO|nr:uncharacterized protein Kpol_1010p67 [Vanderwaltozyma polyspora DSM 70294]EDO17949.1 hypothetical protein Kpol_1010p67 [Vanderwaltozyma polyspora DSM 70294]
MSLVIKSRSKSLKDTEIDLTKTSKVQSILEIISLRNKNINTNRLRLSVLKESKYVPISTDEALKEEAKKDGVTEIYVKDIGPQISWRLVFLIEYCGPILIHTFFYHLSTLENVRDKVHSSRTSYDPFYNKIVYSMVVAHYAKREFESIFVHKFSQPTMPFFNLFKNSFHYWVLNGMIAFSYFGYGFLLSDSTIQSLYAKLGLSNLSLLIALFTVSELWNMYIHIKLRLFGDAQKKLGNATKRVALNEGFFKIFVAPNYTFEVWSWIWFTFAAKLNFFALLFLFVSAGQMYLWAEKKNRKYGTKRAFLIPFIF